MAAKISLPPASASDCDRSGDIDRLLRGSELAGRSSIDLGWEGLVLEHRLAPPMHRRPEVLDKHYILLWRGSPTHTEREYKRGRFTRIVKRPGTLSIGPAGDLPAVRSHSRYDVLAAVLDPAAATRFAEEEDERFCQPLYEHLGMADHALASLIELAACEADESGMHGKLYGQSLVCAIIARFNDIAHKRSLDRCDASALPKSRLQRVLEKIEAEFHRDISLEELARESGYSRAHFLRMFRAATGTTPHRHLLTTRLERARDQLLTGAPSITEVALACGFSSHAHLTRHFRQHFGTTPSDARRKK